MAKAVHTMLRVTEEIRSVAFYHRAFGLDIVGRYAFEGFTLVYLAAPEGGFELELTINTDHTGPYSLGDGYGHMAFVVDDIAAEHARFTEVGLDPRPIVEMLHEGHLFARFFFVTDPDGYRIEVIQKAGRFG